MKMTQCRVCNQDFFKQSLVQYKNMPKSAQFLPDADEIINDRGVDIDVCQCKGCGLVQLSNEAVFYFREVIRATAVSVEMAAFRRQQFKRWFEKYALHGKKIVEIGCGAGEFLTIMQENDIQLYGLEQRQVSVEKCASDGFKVEHGFIDNAKQVLNNAPFDAFYMLNFLEHLADPNSTLKGIAHNLVDEGIGLVEVPNFDMILRNNLFSEFISDHLFYFTRDTFISTLNRNGFDVLECTEVWHDYSLSAVVKKRKKMDLSTFYQFQQRLKKEIHQYISQFSDGSVAIWGAGHQALAIMSLTELQGKICYVVDSASFKQEKYTPATHIPIVHPDTLIENPVEAIIIMAASYSDEVLNIIQKKYQIAGISVLRESGLEIAK